MIHPSASFSVWGTVASTECRSALFSPLLFLCRRGDPELLDRKRSTISRVFDDDCFCALPRNDGTEFEPEEERFGVADRLWAAVCGAADGTSV